MEEKYVLYRVPKRWNFKTVAESNVNERQMLQY